MRPSIRRAFGALGASPWMLSASLCVLGACLCVFVTAPAVAGADSLESGKTAAPQSGEAAYGGASKIADTTWADDDARPEPRPAEGNPGTVAYYFRECLVEPVSHLFDVPDKLLFAAKVFGAHPDREAVNVNAFDEVPNSSWFTNRNAMRSIPVADLLQGPDSVFLPELPWTITGAKVGGMGRGFTIKDAAGKKWAVELDPRGYPQLCSGADVVARTILHAAGYNVPHNEPVRFRREDLKIDAKLLNGPKDQQLEEADLDTLLADAAVFADGRYGAKASLWLPGHVLGSPSSRGHRKGDLNDWYHHEKRRELRGLYVVSSWIGHWDTKDPNLLDVFTGNDSIQGHVEHYLLDCDEALGAEATGPKSLREGYEQGVDWGWIGRRVVTLGFVVEPWRKARQETGMPSVGNFTSDHFEPGKFAHYENPAMREMTDRDAYWGAKIVASFSDAQVAAAVDAAHYDDPRARDYLVKTLIERRDKVVRHWFRRVAPLDFFSVREDTLRFHDLAVDVGLVEARGYGMDVKSEGGSGPVRRHLDLNGPGVALNRLDGGASRLTLEFRVAGSEAKPAWVELTRRGSAWMVTRVRHG